MARRVVTALDRLDQLTWAGVEWLWTVGRPKLDRRPDTLPGPGPGATRRAADARRPGPGRRRMDPRPRAGAAWTRPAPRGVVFGAALLSAPAVGAWGVHLVTSSARTVRPVYAAAVTRAAVARPHLGFDTRVYPGTATLRAWQQAGAPYSWIGYYLPSPCHRETSWRGTRDSLRALGLGTAVLYVGQQTWGRTPSPGSRAEALARTRGEQCNAHFVSAAQGARDGDDAARQARAEGFPAATIVFLDIERMDVLAPAMRQYYAAWTRAVLADGRYRPGAYVHAVNAPTIAADLSAVYAQQGVPGLPPLWVARGRGFSPTSSWPVQLGQAGASIWQGRLDVSDAYAGVRLPLDVNVADSRSPSDAYARALAEPTSVAALQLAAAARAQVAVRATPAVQLARVPAEELPSGPTGPAAPGAGPGAGSEQPVAGR